MAGLLAGSVIAKFQADLTEFKKGVGDAQNQVSSLKDNTVNASKLMVAGFAAVGAGLVVVAKKAIDAAAGFEQSQIAFGTMLGSAEKATELLEKLADFAKRTPFELTGIESTAKLLLAMGATAEEIIPELTMLGDVAAGLGAPIERIALNFGQVRTQGKLTGREMRDFAILGVPIIDELAKSLGVAKEQIADMVSAGEVGFPEVQQAFKNMSGEGGKFFNLMDKQSHSLTGKISNLKDAVNQMLRELGVNGLEPAKKFVDFLINKAVPGIKAFVLALKENKPALAAVGATISVLILPALIAWAVAATAAAIATLAAALPLIALAAAVGAAVYLIMTNWDQLTQSFDTGKQGILATIESLKTGFNDLVAGAVNAFNGFLAFVTPIWEAIKAGFMAFFTYILDIFNVFFLTPLQLQFAVAARILWELYQIFEIVFNWIVANIIAPWVAAMTAHFQALSAFLTGVWNALAGFAAAIWAKIRDSIIAPILAAKERVSAINEEAKTIVLGIFNAIWEGLKSIGAKILDAIVSPFEAAKNRIRDIANEIKELAKKISPFHKESPSLVELVQKGTTDIADLYAGMANKIKGIDFRGDLFNAVLGSGQAAPAAAAGNTYQTDINISGVTLGDALDLNTLGERLGWEFERRTDL